MWKITGEIHKCVFSHGKCHVCLHVVKFSRKFTTRNMLKKHENMVGFTEKIIVGEIKRWNLRGIPNENMFDLFNTSLSKMCDKRDVDVYGFKTF